MEHCLLVSDSIGRRVREIQARERSPMQSNGDVSVSTATFPTRVQEKTITNSLDYDRLRQHSFTPQFLVIFHDKLTEGVVLVFFVLWDIPTSKIFNFAQNLWSLIDQLDHGLVAHFSFKASELVKHGHYMLIEPFLLVSCAVIALRLDSPLHKFDKALGLQLLL